MLSKVSGVVDVSQREQPTRHRAVRSRTSAAFGLLALCLAACAPAERVVTAPEPAERVQASGGHCRPSAEPYNAFTARILSLEDVDGGHVSVTWKGELEPVTWRIDREYLERCATLGPRPGSDFVVGHHHNGTCAPILRARECSAVPPAAATPALPAQPQPVEGAAVSDERRYGLRGGRSDAGVYSMAAVRPCSKGACAGPPRPLEGRVVAVHAVDLAVQEARHLERGAQLVLPPTAKRPTGIVLLERERGAFTATIVVAFGLLDDQPLAFERSGETTASPQLGATRSDGSGLSVDGLELAFDDRGQPLLRAKTRASPSLMSGGSGERVDTWTIVAVQAR